MKIHLMNGSSVEVALDTKEKNSPKKGKWLNKDRFWTLVFWFGMSLGLSLADFAKFTLGAFDASLFINWGTLLGVPLIVTLANRTRFITKDTFENSEGMLITEKQMPYSFLLPTLFSFGVASIVGDMILSKPIAKDCTQSFIFWWCFFSGFSLYFILKNCPVSILFNRKFWTFEFRPRGAGRSSFHNSYSSSSSNRSSLNDYYTSPSYSSSMSNIYYDSHRRH